MLKIYYNYIQISITHQTICLAIPVTGCGGPQGCEMSRLPHFLDSWLTDGGEVVNLMHWLPFTQRKITGTHFCYRLSRSQTYSVAGKIRSIEKSNNLIGNAKPRYEMCSGIKVCM
jgi:hypothetical protein